MRISSNYDDYYYWQNYQLNSLSNATLTTGTSGSSQNEAEAVSFRTKRASAVDGYEGMMNLSISGKMMKDSLQMQGTDSSGISEKMEKLRTDMDSIKTADIDSMSADDVKEALAQLKADMEAVPKPPDGSAAGVSEIDLDSMTESDMRDMLKKIQEQANSVAEMGGGMPPMMGGGMPPMMAGFDPSQLLNGVSGNQEDIASLSNSSDTQSILQQIVEKLTESYDSSAENSDDYVEKLKSSLSSMFSQQKSNIDSFASIIFDKLDDWNTSGKTTTQEV